DHAAPAAARAARRWQRDGLWRPSAARANAGALLLDPRRHARDPARRDCTGARPQMSSETEDAGVRDLMLRSLDRIVEEKADNAVQAADGKPGFPADLWAALEEAGMTALGEENEGDLGLGNAAALMERAAYHTLPVPLAETILARRLLAKAGMGIPDGALSVAPPSANRDGKAAGVPWGGAVVGVVVATGADTLALIDAREVALLSFNMAGEPRDTIDL